MPDTDAVGEPKKLLEATPKMVRAVERVILVAWQVNGDRIYPVGAGGPDAAAMAAVAAQAASAVFVAWLDRDPTAGRVGGRD